MTLSWQKRRSEFNHDWFKNKFIPALEKWINLLDDQIEDAAFERTFVSDVLYKWEQHKDEVLDLLNDFESEMSPKILFKEYPLSNCDEDTKHWLGDLIHNMWLVRCSVSKLVEDGLSSVNEVGNAYNGIQSSLKTCENVQHIEKLRTFRSLFETFLKSCRNLAQSIEKFPGEVIVV